MCSIYLVTILTACASAPQYYPPHVVMHNSNVQVMVSTQSSTSVPPNLVGFSIETNQICTILRLAEQDPAYAQLYINLGASVLRIGGNSVDNSEWLPGGTATCDAYHTIVTRDMIRALFSFARRIHWQVIWGLNMAQNIPELTADEAEYIVRAGHDRLLGFTIGNEPELYTQRGIRPRWWGEDNYLYEWRRYQRSILRRIRATFIGPEACCGTPLFDDFLRDPSASGISISSHHLYGISNTTQGVTLYPSIPLLLNQFTLHNEEKLLDQWTNEAISSRKILELTEVNSVSGGGAAGISNTLAAALWANDLLFQSALRSLRQVDFHNAPGAVYNAIDDQGHATPLYYGLLLFHFATRNARLLPTTIKTVLNLSGYALQGINGAQSIILINKERTKNAYVHLLFQFQSFKQVSIVRLTSPGIAATSGIVLSQRTLSANNTWSPQPLALPWQRKQGIVEVPASSEVLVMLQ